MVIDYTASWCGPCKFMEPIIKTMASKYIDVSFIKTDVDELSICPYKFHFYIFAFLSNER